MSQASTLRRHHPLYLFLTGLCMGSADVVPGVSGGTIAFIMGVYHQLLAAIRAFDLDLVRGLLAGDRRQAFARIPWRFLVPLGLGIVTAIFSLAELLTYLLQHHEPLLFAFFFGLVSASVVALGGRNRWPPRAVVSCLVGAVVAYWIVGLVPAQPGHTPLILFGSGAVAICAMILPGISGSFILLVLGQYEYCVSAISRFADALRAGDLSLMTELLLTIIIPAGAGMVLGLMLFARILSWLLGRYGTVTVAALIGFMIGSLRRLWPFKQYLEFGVDRHGEPVPLRWQNIMPGSEDPVAFALLLCLVGFMIIIAIDHASDRRNPLVLLLTQGRMREKSHEVPS